MAAGDVVGTKPCSRCGGTMTYKETKSGGVSGSCSDCKRQTFDRTPRATAGVKKFFEDLLAGRPAGTAAGGKGWFDKL